MSFLKSGTNGCEVPPVPIPNTEVKLTHAEDTWLATTRENRTAPESLALAVNFNWLPKHYMRAISSVGQSIRLITGRSWVRVPDGPLFFNSYIKGYSSVGRAAVSKTACRGFESFCPCQRRSLTNCDSTWFVRLFYYVSIQNICFKMPVKCSQMTPEDPEILVKDSQLTLLTLKVTLSK